MSVTAEVEMTNMCMIYDRTSNRVLVQERIKGWKGIAFPGGHVEDGESIVESTVREIKEETGLTVSNLKPCGVIHWYNDKTRERYIVFYFKTEIFSGELIDETTEGKVFWVDKDELCNLKLCDGFEKQVHMFFEDRYWEGFATWNDEGTTELRWL